MQYRSANEGRRELAELATKTAATILDLVIKAHDLALGDELPAHVVQTPVILTRWADQLFQPDDRRARIERELRAAVRGRFRGAITEVEYHQRVEELRRLGRL
jgi:hypothetical protein